MPKREADAFRAREACQALAQKGMAQLHECDQIFAEKMRQGSPTPELPAARIYTIPPSIGPIEVNGLTVGTGAAELDQRLRAAGLGRCRSGAGDELRCEVPKSFRFGGVPARSATIRMSSGKLHELRVEFDAAFTDAVYAAVATTYNAPHDSAGAMSVWSFRDGGRIVIQPAETNGRTLLLLSAV
jgi:hypothetical protein